MFFAYKVAYYPKVKSRKNSSAGGCRLLDTGYSAKGSMREMHICMQQFGRFRDDLICFYLFKWMVWFNTTGTQPIFHKPFL